MLTTENLINGVNYANFFGQSVGLAFPTVGIVAAMTLPATTETVSIELTEQIISILRRGLRPVAMYLSSPRGASVWPVHSSGESQPAILNLEITGTGTDLPEAAAFGTGHAAQLFELFFGAGFFYAKKYSGIAECKGNLLALYDRIYSRPNSIAKAFNVEDAGQLTGHISTLHFQPGTCLCQHHAALKSHKKAGLTVLQELLQHSIDTAGSYQYFTAYFRPENHVPATLFGGFTKRLANPEQAVSVPMDYLHVSGEKGSLPKTAQVREVEAADLDLLRSTLGEDQLLIDVMRLDASQAEENRLNLSYAALGLFRKRKMQVLEVSGTPAAVLIAHAATRGLNLSELTNSISVFVVADVDQVILLAAVNNLAADVINGQAPALVWPSDANPLSSLKERVYCAWGAKAESLKDFVEYSKRVARLKVT